MTTSPKRIADLFLRRAAGGDDGSSSSVTPGQFADLIAFYLGVDAYFRLKGADEFMKRSVPLVLRYQDEVAEGCNTFLVPLLDDPGFGRFKHAVTVAARPLRGLDHAVFQARAFGDVLEALRAKGAMLRDVFSDARAYTAAQKLSAIVVNDAPESILNALTTVPSASRLQLTKKWIREAASQAGVSPSSIETVLADAADARDLGKDLHTVQVQLASTDPLSEMAAELQDKRLGLMESITAVADSSADPAVVLSAAATEAAKPHDYATATAKSTRLSPDQERAMMLRGKAIIAAGAGSGKTATLASKVVYHINEIGTPPGSVIATSFSRKSAAELRKRIEKYGANIPSSAETGFGTTHSIAGKLMREYGGGGREGLKNFEQTNLVRLAMEQVKMSVAGVAPPPPTSLFAGLPAPDTAPDAAPPGMTTGLTFKQACELAYQRRDRIRNAYLRSFIESYFNPRDKWYASTMRMTRNLADPRGLSDKQSDILKDIFQQTGIHYTLATDPNFAQSRTAAKDKDKGLREKFTFFSRPAGQWFNLGRELVEEGAKGEKKPIPIGVFKQAITKFKGRAVSPSEAWHLTNGSDEAAVYAAYEWLKGPSGEVDFQNRGDFDDILLDVSKMILSSPRIMKQVQSRFKVILVDEAQDLNRAQHVMFGLLAGFIDPAKITKVAHVKRVGELAKDDGSMTADTYCFIGDDKQAIYEFRGADPEAFIDMSDLVEGGAGFKTEVLKTNYRSGELIVEAANRLIAHNCVEAHTPIATANGPRPAADIKVGDVVVTYHNGELAHQRVASTMTSAWAYGFRIVTESGHSLTMSPNHRLWATEPEMDGMNIVYLMFRKDLGFRVGTTKGPFGNRAAMEWGERMWVLSRWDSTEEALFEEQSLSLRYAIPMTTFNSGPRGPSADRIQRLFEEFGANGARMLEERHLSFDHPHWAAQSQRRGSRVREVISLQAHTPISSQVYLRSDGTHPTIRRFFKSYVDATNFAENLSREMGCLFIAEKMPLGDHDLRLLTASALFVGMRVPVKDGDNVALSPILSIERVTGSFVDLEVETDSNFFGGGILSHNSRQIPMTCKANPQRVDRGGIDVTRFAPVEGRDMSAPAAWLAQTIADDIEEGRAGKKGYDAYGVGLRSNAEAYTYGLELLKKGIPFRSKANFFNDPNTKALLHWLTIADEGLAGDPDRVNAAVLGARSAPATKLGPKFEENLTQMATGNYLLWLKDNWQRVFGTGGQWGDLVRTYTDNLLRVAGMKGQSAETVLGEVLALQGFDGRNVKDVLLDKVREDEEVLAEIRSESPTGEVTEEAISEVAFAPLAPLKGLLGARPDLTEAMKYVRQLQSANAKLTAVDDPEAKGFTEPAVTLGTMHSWKGLEVENMFIPLVGGRFPRSDASEEELASERRLAYVAVTRGENRVLVMDIPTARPTKQGMVILESQFVSEMCVPPSKSTPPAPDTLMGDEDDEMRELEANGIPVLASDDGSYSPLDPEAMDAYLQGRE